MSVDIQALLSGLEAKIVDLAKATFSDFTNQAASDGKQLLSVIEDDLVRWTQELADARITKLDFETLLIGQKDLVEMSALKQTGLALARIDDFKNKVFSLILNTVTSLV